MTDRKAAAPLALLLGLAACPAPPPTPDEVAQLRVEVDQEPVVLLEAPAAVQVGEELTADASASFDVDGEVLAFELSFGDGTPAKGDARATHRYARAGQYTIEARATDDAGNTGRARVRVTVAPPDDALPPTITSVELRRGDETLADGAAVETDEPLTLIVHAADEGDSPDALRVRVEGADGATEESTLPWDGGIVVAEIHAPPAAGDASLVVLASDRWGNESQPATRALRVLEAGHDGDGDGLADIDDPQPAIFNGVLASTFAIDSIPKSLIGRERAEEVDEAVRAATPLTTAQHGAPFLSGDATSAPAIDGAWAVLYSGLLSVPDGADGVVVEVTADGVGVVFLEGQPVASADEEYALNFLGTERVPAVSPVVPALFDQLSFELLVADEDADASWDVRLTFFDGDSVVLGPEEVSTAMFLAP